MRIRLVSFLVLLLLAAGLPAARQNGSDLYQQGLARETAGDLKGAMQIFERIVRDSTDRALTARALVQLGRWSDLLGHDQARKYYERVVREFADQKNAVADARARLDALGQTAPGASPARRLVVDWQTFSGPARNGKVTRDGRHVLEYSAKDRAFVQVDVSTGSARPLTDDSPSAAAWTGWSAELSTDGRRLAASIRAGAPQGAGGQPAGAERVELRVFDVGGRGPGRTLATWDAQTLGSFGVRAFAWSPRDDRVWMIVFRSDQSAQIASVDMSGRLQVLKTLAWRNHSQLPSLSPDGRFVAYHDGTDRQAMPDIYILASDGSREHRLEHPANDSKPMFAPDGSGVVFESNRRGGRDLWFVALTDGRPAGEPRLVWRNLGSFGSVDRFSEAGSLYFFFATNDYATYTATIDAGPTGSLPAPRRLALVNNEPNGGAAFSPDGRYLAHFRDGARLVLRELATGREREIAFGVSLSAGYAQADWCSNGDTIAVSGYTDAGAAAYRVRVKDASVEKLPISDVRHLVCVGDTNDIIYVTTGRGAIVRRASVSGRETTLFEGTTRAIARSTDGTRLAFVVMDPNGRDARLVTMPATGGAVTDLMPVGTIPAGPRRVPVIFDLAWMPGDDRLLVAAHEEGFTSIDVRPDIAPDGVEWLWEVPLTGGSPRRIGNLRMGKMEGRSYYGINQLTLHPDGKQLAFQRHEGFVSQTWALDNLLQFIKAGR